MSSCDSVPQMEAQPDALRELHQLRRVELLVELGLAGENDAQHLLLGGLDAGEQADLLEHSSERFCASSTISSTLRPAAYCSMRKLLSVAISSAFFILKGEKPNCTSTDCRNSTADDLGLVDLRDDHVRIELAQEGLDERGLAGADLAGDDDEAIGEPDGRLHVRLGARMGLRQVQELRVRAEPERQLLAV